VFANCKVTLNWFGPAKVSCFDLWDVSGLYRHGNRGDGRFFTTIRISERQKRYVIDNYFGVKVPDPYRWLENVDSPETLQWINEENRLTQSYLRELPERDPFRDRLAKLLNFERYTVPIWEGGRLGISCFSKISAIRLRRRWRPRFYRSSLILKQKFKPWVAGRRCPDSTSRALWSGGFASRCA
jgi:hypothetical protein